ncbi:S-adenosyl-L-methionine-dependent methyltransferase [Pleomassaria siparia CBS 279.74]|uniref:S-adenosyl-L-methionine-dependent methyltransferase n=1 Tax=Pleomassaria siparia CBS 279.74 TaxID=1314801 RepID=A0A6G1JR00_9PLEO|nr:S-adenosyl-L-methionine-dependent methyltransferase [Pleomassaria siparia CBS 279.74]
MCVVLHYCRSSTTSAQSDVYETVEEFGRTYHGFKQGKYVMPNDEKERDRLDLQHALWVLTLDGALSSVTFPVPPRRVLDIATGTGLWCLEYAEQNPTATVLGTDLSPIQPTFVPVNCSFEIADAEDEWNYSDKFDFIHGRALLSCFVDPREIIWKAYEALEPGGYLELQDGLFPFQFLDPQPPPEHPLRVFLENALQASHISGRPWDNAQHYARWMTELGFQDVVEKRYNWPCGPWAKGEKMKTLGVYFQEDLKHAVDPICLKLFVKVLGWSEERTKEFLETLKPELGKRKVHLFETVLFIQGRKPLSA